MILSSQVKILVDPIVNINYASFYLYALMEKFGRKNITYTTSPFKQLENRSMCFNFIIINGESEKKYCIDFNDFYQVKPKEYEWCDVYGHVNANFDKTPAEYHSKLVSLVPSFGIKIWDKNQTLYYAFSNLLKVLNETNLRKFLGKYKKQLRDRLEYEQYQVKTNSNKKENNYIFHLSTMWYNDEWNKNDEKVNMDRYKFIIACKSITDVTFEGGLSVSENQEYNKLFEKAIFKGRVPMLDYLNKTKESLVVFNTPAFWNCHGWKLGEYLSLGKAIISTPLSNDLPNPLIHGESIHFIENSSEEKIKEAIEYLIQNPKYRNKLEYGAKEYWEKYGSPIKSLELLGIY